MYCTWESIDTDDGPQTTDHGRHTLNLYYYLRLEPAKKSGTDPGNSGRVLVLGSVPAIISEPVREQIST